MPGLSFRNPLGTELPLELDPAYLIRLVQRLRGGDDTVVEIIAAGHYRLAFHIVGQFAVTNKHIADDILGEAFLKLIELIRKARDKLKDDGITLWLGSHLRRHLFTYVREQGGVITISARRCKKKPNVLATSYEDCVVIYGRGDSLVDAEWNKLGIETEDTTYDITDAIKEIKLDETDRKILNLKIEGFNDREIAEKLGKSNSYVALRRSSIQQKLLRMLDADISSVS